MLDQHRAIPSRPGAVAGLLVLALVAPALAADFALESAGGPPAEVPASLREMIHAEGVRVKDAAGKVAAEFWGRSTAFEGEGDSGFGIRYGEIPPGAFLAVARFPEAGSDFREQQVSAGLYTLRFGLHPEDGNHMGVAASRDFGLLSPLAEDQDGSVNYGFDELMQMSYKTGNAHPTIMRMRYPEGDEAPHLWLDENEHWVLDFEVAGEVVAVVVHGHAEE